MSVHYAVRATTHTIFTACNRRVRKQGNKWTTAAAAVECLPCEFTDAWKQREARLGLNPGADDSHLPLPVIDTTRDKFGRTVRATTR